MTAHNYSAVVDHTSDAGFRAWGSTLSANLAIAGLVQTSDTGQINWVTVNRPTSNSVGGYEIWRLPSSALYFKIEYATQTSAAVLGLWMTVGTGSNGSGTLTGQSTTRALICQSNLGVASAAIAYTTFICVTDDTFNLCFAQSSTTQGGAHSIFLCSRSVDSAGVTTTVGYKQISLTSTPNMSGQDVRTASPAFTSPVSQQFCFAAGSPSSGVLNNGDNEVWLCWSDYKDGMQPHIGGLGYVQAEWAKNTTKTITPFGATPHTYLAIGGYSTGNNSGPVNAGVTGYGLAMLYE